ncbi:hypothetical protein JAAARDRAFT_30775 [Jaapia argillacea MUCL 33604]|uniref:Uncharacterized protein n=1 Tax=Jaapia argillacea MUCL 33604 TaxID=933084 RepID=A0A067Q2Y4_9AGAM|nr:hypothetical protein JAAARDRAFT_30775 [Jaapia argillacea MUCL 33604]
MSYEPFVSASSYRYALENFRIAHERNETLRLKLEQQEDQIQMLRGRIATLERVIDNERDEPFDESYIANFAFQLEREIHRWAANITREPPLPLGVLRDATVADLTLGDCDGSSIPATPMNIQNLLRNAISEAISEGFINSFPVTSSPESNSYFTRVYEQLFAKDPTVAGAWRRRTFSSPVETFTPRMACSIMAEHLPLLSKLLGISYEPTMSVSSLLPVLKAGYEFSRMLHGSISSGDAWYRSYIPELSSDLNHNTMVSIKRCSREVSDQVGATVFLGLARTNRELIAPAGNVVDRHYVLRRARVVCTCALSSFSTPPKPPQRTNSLPTHESQNGASAHSGMLDEYLTQDAGSPQSPSPIPFSHSAAASPIRLLSPNSLPSTNWASSTPTLSGTPSPLPVDDPEVEAFRNTLYEAPVQGGDDSNSIRPTILVLQSETPSVYPSRRPSRNFGASSFITSSSPASSSYNGSPRPTILSLDSAEHYPSHSY